MIRFTAWLEEPEDDLLRERAFELGLSMNHVARIALRAGLGLPVPVRLAELVQQPEPQLDRQTTAA